MLQTQKVPENIVEKIQKLIALGQSPNENEAKLAIANANKLLIKYNLTLTDVETKEEGVTQFSIDVGKRVPQWKSILLKGICTTNFCDVIVSRSNYASFLIIGRTHNTKVAFELYLYLIEAVESWAKENGGKGMSAKNSYKIGMTMGLCDRLQQIQHEATNHGIEETTAVVIYDLYKKSQLENRDYMNSNFNLKKTTARPKISNGAEYNKGRQDSNKISLNKQLK